MDPDPIPFFGGTKVRQIFYFILSFANYRNFCSYFCLLKKLFKSENSVFPSLFLFKGSGFF
jgi:hypothetical protein